MKYVLTISGGGSIRIEREGHGQTISHERLCRDGWNAISHSAGLIEQMIAGKVKRP